jgi:type II secretory ATPase GspE/PulE/Tfp pilus assembly ATPase PilB-like protein
MFLLAAATDFGPYLAWWKAVPLLVLFFVWARLLTWIDKDLVAAMLIGVVAFFLLPGFLIAFGVFAFMMVASIGTYVGYRGNKAGLADLKDSILEDFNSMLGRKEKSEKDLVATGDFAFMPKTGATVRNPDAEDPNRLGFDAMCIIMIEPMTKNAHAIEMTPAGDSSNTRFWVDGVAYDGQKLEKSQAAEAVAFVKRLAGLDVDERRKPQTGKFKMAFAGNKHEAAIRTLGSSSGESLRIEFDVAARYQLSAPQLGMNADQLQHFEDTRDEPGLVILAMPKGLGLTTLQYAMLRNHDAFTSHILTVERDPPIDLEGISQDKLLPKATPEDEASRVSWATSQEPSVILTGPLESRQSAASLIQYAKEKRVYIGARAGDVFEAIEAWRKLVSDDKAAASQLKYVVAGRVFRRLCDGTKIPYAPDEKLLKQLGMSSKTVTELYKPNTTGMIKDARGNDVADDICFGLGYQGRFGVYELFVIDDEVRQAIASNANAQALRALFRKQKRRYLQELALVRVENGDTSVQEFLRVLKSDDSKNSKPPTSGGSSPPRPSSGSPSRPPSSKPRV